MSHCKVLGLGVVALSFITSVAAAEPFTADKAQVGGQLMYGIDMEDGNLNAYGVGLAPQGGYTISPGIYIGARFDYFFGGSETVSGFGVVRNIEYSANVWQFLLEPGYDIGVGDATVIRPKLGLGFGNTVSESCAGNTCVDIDTDTSFALSVGANFLYDFDPVYLNFDLRYNTLMLKDESIDGIVLGAGVGFAF